MSNLKALRMELIACVVRAPDFDRNGTNRGGYAGSYQLFYQDFDRIVDQIEAAARREGARAMRQKAADAAVNLETGFACEYREDVADAIAALPLEPEETK